MVILDKMPDRSSPAFLGEPLEPACSPCTKFKLPVPAAKQLRGSAGASLAVPAQVSDVAVTNSGKELRVTFGDRRVAHFYSMWLRDNDQSVESRDPGNGQRLF